MKKLALTGFATLALAAAAFAQGLVAIDDSASGGGIADLKAGSYYSGPFGMEVWDLAGSTIPTGINNATDPGAAYTALTTGANKFTQVALSPNTATIANGTFSFGTANMLLVSPAGANVVMALAVWNNSMATWATGTAVSGAHAGVLAFINPTVNPAGSPPPTPAALSGFASDLVMSPLSGTPIIPEPGTLALAGLGLASLLIFRRRK